MSKHHRDYSAEQLASTIEDATNRLQDSARELGERTVEMAELLQAHSTHAAHQVSTAGRRAAREARDLALNNPKVSIAVLLGAGFVAGGLYFLNKRR